MAAARSTRSRPSSSTASFPDRGRAAALVVTEDRVAPATEARSRKRVSRSSIVCVTARVTRRAEAERVTVTRDAKPRLERWRPEPRGLDVATARAGRGLTCDHLGRATLLELLDRRVAQQQALDALGPEVDRGHGLLRDPVDGDDGAHPERVVHDPVARARGSGSRGPAWPWRRRRRAWRPRRSCGGRRRWGCRGGWSRRCGRGGPSASARRPYAASRRGRPGARRGTGWPGCGSARPRPTGPGRGRCRGASRRG